MKRLYEPEVTKGNDLFAMIGVLLMLLGSIGIIFGTVIFIIIQELTGWWVDCDTLFCIQL